VDGDVKIGSIENQMWNYSMDRGERGLQWPLFEDWPMENMALSVWSTK